MQKYHWYLSVVPTEIFAKNKILFCWRSIVTLAATRYYTKREISVLVVIEIYVILYFANYKAIPYNKTSSLWRYADERCVLSE